MTDSLLSNINAFHAARKLGEHSADLSKTFQRLSSGLRINTASDDAAGLAVSESLKAKSAVYGQAIRNVNDGISMLNVAEGALSEMRSILTRIKELATRAADGTMSLSQRRVVDQEAADLSEEFNRIEATTKFNGQSVFEVDKGTTSIQAGFGSADAISFTLSNDLERDIGDGSFGSANTIYTGYVSLANSSADFNNDGLADLFSTTQAIGFQEVSISDGDGTFTESALNSGLTPTNMLLGDFDNDNNADILMTEGSTVYFYAGDGAGGFAAADTTALGQTPIGSTGEVADMDNDGNLDLVYGEGSNIYINYGNGDGTFGAATLTGTNVTTSTDLAIGDFDGDGLQDIAATQGSTGTLYIFENNGTTGAYDVTDTQSHSYMSKGSVLEVGDFNNDGLDDLLAQKGEASDIILSNGDGTMQAAYNNNISGDIRIADMNGDGYLDLLAVDGTDMSVATGNGDGTFTAGDTTTTTSVDPTSRDHVLIGDIDGDGINDAIVGRASIDFAVHSYLGGSEEAITLQRFYLLDQDTAQAAMDEIDNAITRVATEQGKVGAFLSRFDIAVSNLESLRMNTDAAISRITDIDVAEETARMVSQQILVDAASAVLAQANQSTESVLQLLSF